MQRHEYVKGWMVGGEKFHDISGFMAQQAATELDKQMRAYPKRG